ncbi:MAG: hypothetical protein U0Z75_10635 [Deinococcaceae bacterium]
MRLITWSSLCLTSLLVLGACSSNTSQPQPEPTYSAQIFRPSDFKGGEVNVALKDLTADESVAVIAVNAEQLLYPEGFQYSLDVNNIAPMAKQSIGVISEAQNIPTSTTTRESQRFTEGQDIVKRMLKEKIMPLSQNSTNLPFRSCAAPYAIEKVCSFWISDSETKDPTGQVSVETELRLISKNAYWFVDKQDLGDLSDDELSQFAKVFEDKLFSSDVNYFGPPADLDNNGKIKIVFSHLIGKEGNFGYVWGVDWFSDKAVMKSQNHHSNEGDIFYAATPASRPDITRERMLDYELPATLVHELKHLISGANRLMNGGGWEESWVEEASAVSAEQLAGFGTQMGNFAKRKSIKGLSAPQNTRIFLPDDLSEEELDQQRPSFYGYNFLFLWRVAERFGHDAFWKKWAVNSPTGIQNLEAVTHTPFSELVLDWAQSLMFSNTGIAPQFDYKDLNLRDHLNGESDQTWTRLAYRPLTSLSDNARSMAYYVGQGQGKDARITLKSDSRVPYFVVARFKGQLPWGPTNHLSGTINVPEGYSVNGAVVQICEWTDGKCEANSFRKNVDIKQEGTTAAFSFTAIPDKTYGIVAYKDENQNGKNDAGDLWGCLSVGLPVIGSTPQCSAIEPSEGQMVIPLQQQ